LLTMRALPLAKDAEPCPGYRLVQHLGRGGCGEVWKAVGPEGRPEALKFLFCDSDLVAGQEVRALQMVRQLRHPHLMGINQVWCTANYIIIAMELAEGSLLDLLDVSYAEFGTPIAAAHLCHFLSQAAAALDFLNTRQHHLGGQRVAVRHCDVKPSNLLVREGQIKVADFSLAALVTAPLGYHRKAGTLDYAAPEVFQGRLSDRTDQYALAVSYVQLRTGQLPFRDTPSTFRSSYVRPTPNLSLVTPPEQPVLRRALDPVPQNRWPSCGEMMERLSECVEE
jgi:serine/threonine protein kinase, bacterial